MGRGGERWVDEEREMGRGGDRWVEGEIDG